AGGGDLERALRVLLASDVGQVGTIARGLTRIGDRRLRRLRAPPAMEQVGESAERRYRAHLDARDERRLGCVRFWHQQAPIPGAPRTEGGVQRAAHRPELAAE